MTKINAIVVADSKNPQGDRLTTMMLTFPRFILAELNTHRMLSKNSASSRAIPFQTMLKSVQEDPFIPIAWQKDHKGMQGVEYIRDLHHIENCKLKWEIAATEAMLNAKKLNTGEVTKQLCNRLLEPFMWHTVLCTATDWENFFSLRCPQYTLHEYNDFEEIVDTQIFKSKKQILELFPNWFIRKDENKRFGKFPKDLADLEWLLLNQGQAEIHMMALAEAMWDAMNESTPEQLSIGQWHIPFMSKMDSSKLKALSGKDITEEMIKISTAMCARVSYTTVGDEKEFGYDKQISLHDRMARQVPFHASPFEHCARVMTLSEYNNYFKATPVPAYRDSWYDAKEDHGWCRNFKGFIQYREILENNNQ